MRTPKSFLVAGLMSLAIIAAFSNPSYAQQAPGGAATGQLITTELKDTVVNPLGSSLSIPAETVHWRGRYGYRSYWGGRRYGHGPYWRGGYGYRSYWGGRRYGYGPYWRGWYGYKPYYRRYVYRTYRYPTYWYPSGWWNGCVY